MNLTVIVTRRSYRVRVYYVLLVLLLAGGVALYLVNDRVCTLCEVYSPGLKNAETYDCTLMDFEPETLICLHDVGQDRLSHEVWKTGLWEAPVVRRFQRWLWEDPDLGVIDLGANVGVYTLLAATMGQRVLAVEPSLENARRLRRTTLLANLAGHVTLLRNAVGDERGPARVLQTHQKDLGRATVGRVTTSGGKDAIHMASAPPGDSGWVNVIHLDDVVPHCAFTKAILKVDIAGAEPLAFRHASKLFRRITIPYVVFDWRNVRPLFDEVVSRHKVAAMLTFLRERRYVAKDHNDILLAHPSHWNLWPDFVVFQLDTRA